MSEFVLSEGSALLVASRGKAEEHGLWRYVQKEGVWSGNQLAQVEQLSSLAWHPSRKVVYGTSNVGESGSIHAWRVEGGEAETLGEKSSAGAEPCHLAVDPSGSLLIVTNYTSSTLAVQPLAANGSFAGDIELLKLEGGGPDSDRQDDAHPHQALFLGNKLFVVDLGADLLREYEIDPNGVGAAALRPSRVTAVPPGAGPRHGVILPDGRLAISGELGSSLLAGRPGAPVTDWADVPSTLRTGPARTRHLRNYPGDIQRSPDGRFVYFANRGYDTISTFEVAGNPPVLVSELDSAVAWPQHLLVLDGWLLVAGWDSSMVVGMPLAEGLPGPAQPLFTCSGAGWLLLQRP